MRTFEEILKELNVIIAEMESIYNKEIDRLKEENELLGVENRRLQRDNEFYQNELNKNRW